MDGILKPGANPPSPSNSEDSTTSANSTDSRKRVRDGDDSTGNDTKRTGKPVGRPKKTEEPDPVLAELRAMRAGQRSQNVLLQELPAIRATIATVSSDLAEVKATTSRLSNTTESLIGITDQLTRENKELRESLAQLETRVNELSSTKGNDSPSTTNLAKLTAAANASILSLQRTRTSPDTPAELTISGLSFASIGNEALIQLFLAIAATLKVQLQPDDLLSARLLRKNTPIIQSSSQGPNQAPTNRTKTTFAVVCKDHRIVTRILGARRSHGVLKYSQLNAGSLTHPELVAGQPGDPYININMLLPMHVYTLKKSAKEALKQVNFKYVWSHNYTVLAQASDNGPIHTINSAADIPRLIEMYTNANK